ncbi:MAG: hypothetical protein HC819_13585 [Cyclobacteriaceae bacterium]|nr:hypothetical protein [Cyclobacteriaceae bacterium]
MEILDIISRLFVSFCVFSTLVLSAFMLLFRFVLYDPHLDSNDSVNYLRQVGENVGGSQRIKQSWKKP